MRLKFGCTWYVLLGAIWGLGNLRECGLDEVGRHLMLHLGDVDNGISTKMGVQSFPHCSPCVLRMLNGAAKGRVDVEYTYRDGASD